VVPAAHEADEPTSDENGMHADGNVDEQMLVAVSQHPRRLPMLIHDALNLSQVNVFAGETTCQPSSCSPLLHDCATHISTRHTSRSSRTAANSLPSGTAPSGPGRVAMWAWARSRLPTWPSARRGRSAWAASTMAALHCRPMPVPTPAQGMP